jgi:hypothetical protein
MLKVVEHLHQLIEKHKSAESDRNGRKPSGGQAGDQQRPDGGQQRPDGGQQRPDGGQAGDQQHVDTQDEEEHEGGMRDHRIRTPSSSSASSRPASPTPSSSSASSRPASPPPPHAYGRRVNPEHNGVLTYYVLTLDTPLESLESWLLPASQLDLCEFFDVPSDSRNIKVHVKEQDLAKYEIVPITLDAELTFTIWEIDADHIAVYYCGMYEPGSNADPLIRTLKSPPELPDA